MKHLTSSTIKSSDTGRTHVHHRVETIDPFVSPAETFEKVNAQLNELTNLGFWGDTTVNLQRKRKGTIDRTNPATAALIEQLPSFSDWLDLVPTAAALDSLYDPLKGTLANGKPLDPRTAEWLCNITDGRGIRSRAEIVRTIMATNTRAINGHARWLSLASGAAQPIIKTASLLQGEGTRTPAITLVDRDKGSLKLARKYAADAGLGEAVHTQRRNVLKPSGIHRSRGRGNGFANRRGLPESHYDIVEVVGLTEYLLEPDWKYTYSKVIKTTLPMAGAISFLRNAYKLVKPGGTLIIGNMLDTHPQLGFTLNVIQWPHIQPRSIEKMLGIFDRADLSGEVAVYTAQDGAYAIYSISKPGGGSDEQLGVILT